MEQSNPPVSEGVILPQVGECLGPRLEGLALPGSSITEASLLALLPRLTALRRLDLRGLDSLFMSGAFLSREEHRRQVQRPCWTGYGGHVGSRLATPPTPSGGLENQTVPAAEPYAV